MTEILQGWSPAEARRDGRVSAGGVGNCSARNRVSVPKADAGTNCVWTVTSGTMTSGAGNAGIRCMAALQATLKRTLTARSANGSLASGMKNVTVINRRPPVGSKPAWRAERPDRCDRLEREPDSAMCGVAADREARGRPPHSRRELCYAGSGQSSSRRRRHLRSWSSATLTEHESPLTNGAPGPGPR